MGERGFLRCGSPNFCSKILKNFRKSSVLSAGGEGEWESFFAILADAFYVMILIITEFKFWTATYTQAYVKTKMLPQHFCRVCCVIVNRPKALPECKFYTDSVDC